VRIGRRAAAGAVLFAAASALAACGASDAPPAVCASGKGWNDGDEANPLMHPGGTCLSCHAKQDGDAPRFEVAGTVMLGAHDDDDCDGVADALLVFTGADGAKVELATNPVGNFFRTVGEGDPLATPYTVSVELNGTTAKMQGAPASGDCNSCHSTAGSGAPGRIVVTPP